MIELMIRYRYLLVVLIIVSSSMLAMDKETRWQEVRDAWMRTAGHAVEQQRMGGLQGGAFSPRVKVKVTPATPRDLGSQSSQLAIEIELLVEQMTSFPSTHTKHFIDEHLPEWKRQKNIAQMSAAFAALQDHQKEIRKQERAAKR